MTSRYIHTTLFSKERFNGLVLAGGGLAVVSVIAANALLHSGITLLALFAVAMVLLVVRSPVLGVWTVLLLTPIESIGPLTFAMTKVTKLGLTVLVGCTLYLQSAEDAGAAQDNAYRWPFFLALGAGFFSSLLAMSPLMSMIGVASSFIFVLYYSAIRRSGVLVQQGPRLMRMVVLSGVLSSLLCFAQLVDGYSGIFGSPEQRAMEAEGVMATYFPGIWRGSAAFNGPSAAGALLAVAAIVALAHGLVFRKLRGWYFLAALTCVGGVMATFSRGALIGLLAGSIFASWAMGVLRKRRLWLMGCITALALPLLFMADSTRTYLRLGSDLVSVSESRVDAWQATLVILKNHPVFGIGYYEFQRLSQGIEGFSDTPLHPHNGFLKALVEQGPIGGCAYLLYIAIFLRASSKTREHLNNPDNRGVLGSIAGAGVCLFTQELFDANLVFGGSSLAILFASLLGLQCSLQAKIASSAPAAPVGLIPTPLNSPA